MTDLRRSSRGVGDVTRVFASRNSGGRKYRRAGPHLPVHSLRNRLSAVSFCPALASGSLFLCGLVSSMNNAPNPEKLTIAWHWAEPKEDGYGRMAISSAWPCEISAPDLEGIITAKSERPCLLWILSPTNDAAAQEHANAIWTNAHFHGVPALILSTTSEVLGRQVVADHVRIFAKHGEESLVAVDIQDVVDSLCGPLAVVAVKNAKAHCDISGHELAATLMNEIRSTADMCGLGLVLAYNFGSAPVLSEIFKLTKLLRSAHTDVVDSTMYLAVVHDPALAEDELRLTCLIANSCSVPHAI